VAHVHAFQLKGIVAGMFGLMGLFDAEAKANGKGSSPDSLGFSKLLSLLAPLFLMIIRFVSKKGLGWGDVKYGSACGMYAGPLAVFLGFFFAALLAALTITIQKKWHSDKAIAFAPFLALGTAVAGLTIQILQ
jgi:prepilin signal peptidase PulO-like enzyme (type II secretory pathway)